MPGTGPSFKEILPGCATVMLAYHTRAGFKGTQWLIQLIRSVTHAHEYVFWLALAMSKYTEQNWGE